MGIKGVFLMMGTAGCISSMHSSPKPPESPQNLPKDPKPNTP